MPSLPSFLFLFQFVFFSISCVALATPTVQARHSITYKTLQITNSVNVTTVTISNPPINLYDAALSSDMYDFLASLAPSSSGPAPPKVVIFRSANPEFFIAHLDVSSLLLPATPAKTAFVGQYASVTRLLQSLTSTIFIAEVNGEAFGAGNELLVQMDMRFAGPNARAGSLETSIGVTHGSGGLQFLGRLINRGRALQYLLSGDSVDCATGKDLGWFNDCFSTAANLEQAVGALAQRIALRPAGALNATKAGLLSMNPSLDVLNGDLAAFAPLQESAAAQNLIQKFLLQSDNQSQSPFELGLDGTLSELYQ